MLTDQGYYVSTNSQITNETGGPEYLPAIPSRQASNEIVATFAMFNSVAQSLGISIWKTSLRTFWSGIQYLCEHEQAAIQLFGAIIKSEPTFAMRKLLSDPYIKARMLTNEIVAIDTCTPVNKYNTKEANIQT